MSSTTTNLLIALVATSQNNKEITLNTALVALDEAFCASKAEAITDADYVLSQADFLSNVFLKFTGNLTANRKIILPTGVAKWLIVLNGTSTAGGSVGRYELVFQVGTLATVYLTTDTNAHLIYSDGVGNVYKAS